jgi:hypothetical protein
LRRGEVRQRSRSCRELRKIFLIVCEGEKTEPLYFAHFREELRGKVSIKLVDCNIKDAIGLASFAEKQKERLDIDTKGEDRIWIVFDADENSQAQVDRAAMMARRIGADIALSNPCFELWYLLHFEDRREALDRATAVARLRRYLPEYDKSVDCCERLATVQASAMQRAQALEEKAGKPLSIAANPSTGVWRVVGELRGMIRSTSRK